MVLGISGVVAQCLEDRSAAAFLIRAANQFRLETDPTLRCLNLAHMMD